jgi:UDP-glucuronate decarboxylase
MRQTVLVTGAAGFIGSHVVDALLADGYVVVGLDNLMTGDLANLSGAMNDRHFHFEVGDVRERLCVYARLVFNFACPASPVHYQRDPYATLTTSVMGAARLVEMARGKQCTIIHASTSEVYGDPAVHPQTEDYHGDVNPIGVRACYDEGKRAAEAMFNDAARTNGLDVRIARIFNTYGPRMAVDDGRVVSSFIVAALRGEPLMMNGTGAQTRSFGYVTDTVAGLLAMARMDASAAPINIGNPEEVQIGELARLVLVHTQSKSEVVGLPSLVDDPSRRCPDITRARTLLGWEPKVMLNEGLDCTVAYFTAKLNGWL